MLLNIVGFQPTYLILYPGALNLYFNHLKFYNIFQIFKNDLFMFIFPSEIYNHSVKWKEVFLIFRLDLHWDLWINSEKVKGWYLHSMNFLVANKC